MPLPDQGPTSDAAVKAYAGITDDADDARLVPIVAAVNTLVRDLPVVANIALTDDVVTPFPDPVTQGATMLAARLLRRHNSPDGVATFAEQGPVYVQRNDPDIAMLLRLGAWASPAVG